MFVKFQLLLEIDESLKIISIGIQCSKLSGAPSPIRGLGECIEKATRPLGRMAFSELSTLKVHKDDDISVISVIDITTSPCCVNHSALLNCRLPARGAIACLLAHGHQLSSGHTLQR